MSPNDDVIFETVEIYLEAVIEYVYCQTREIAIPPHVNIYLQGH